MVAAHARSHLSRHFFQQGQKVTVKVQSRWGFLHAEPAVQVGGVQGNPCSRTAISRFCPSAVSGPGALIGFIGLAPSGCRSAQDGRCSEQDGRP